MKPQILTRTIAALLTLTVAAHAQTWDGGGVAGGNLDWITGTNWIGDVAPVNNGTANLIFAGVIDNNPGPNLDQNWNVRSVTFNNTAGPFVLGSTGGFTLTLGDGGITNNDTQVQTIGHAVTLGAAQTWSAASSLLSISGAVNNGGSLLTLAGSGPTGVTLSGVVSGAGGLTVSGGSQSLSGTAANTYTGTTTVNGGTLTLQKTPAAVNAVSSTVVVGDGIGTDLLLLGANEQIPNGGTVTVNSSGTFNLAGFNESFLVLNVNGGSVTTSIGTLNISTVVNMTGGSIASIGAGVLLLNGNLTTNAAAASATISGNANLGGAIRSFTVAEGGAANDLDVSAVISNGGINKLGAGMLRLSGNNTFAFGLNATVGTIALGHDSAAGTNTIALSGGTLIADGGPRTLANAFNLTGSSTIAGTNDLTFTGGGTISAAFPTLTVSNTAVTTLSGAIGGGGGTALSKAGAGTLVLGGAGANTFGALFVEVGTVRLSKSAGSDAFGGNLVLNAGTVQLTAANQIPDSAQPFITGTLDLNGHNETFGGNQSIGLVFNNGGTVLTGAGTLSLNGGLSALGSAGGQFTGNMNLLGQTRSFNVNDTGSAIDLDFTGAITSGFVNKDGAGLMRMSGSGSTANFTLSNGTLAVGSDTALGTGNLSLFATIRADGAARTVSNPVFIGNFATDGALNLTFSGPASLLGSQTITTSGTGLTTFSGVIDDGGIGHSLIKSGTGVLRLSGLGSNTYGGVTTVIGGTLQLVKAPGVSAIPGDLIVGDGAGSDIVQVLQDEQIVGSVTVNAAAQFDLINVNETVNALILNTNGVASVGSISGALTVAGGLSMTQGTVTSTAGALSLSSNVTSFAAPFSSFITTLTLGLGGSTRDFDVAEGTAANDLDITASISGSSLNKIGAGTLRFSGANANGGVLVQVNNGTLALAKTAGVNAIAGPLFIGNSVNPSTVRLDAANQISNTIAVTIGPTGVLNLNGFAETIGTLTMNGGAITTGAGALTLTTGVTAGPSSGVAPQISGNLNLGGSGRTFTISDDAGLSADTTISAAISNGGLTKAGAGTLVLSGASTFAGGLFINAGTLALGSDTGAGTGVINLSGGTTLQADGGPRTITNFVGIVDAGRIAGTENLTLNGGLGMGSGSSLTKLGSGTLTLGSGSVQLFGALSLDAGTLAVTGTKTLQPGATLTQNSGTTFSGGTLVNQGTFTYNGGAFNATLQNEGTFVINLGFLAQNGLVNLATIHITPAGSLNANGTGIDNEGTLTLAGGTLQFAGAGPVVNDGEISGFGTISGTGGFTNNAYMAVSGGHLTLDNSGGQTNAGNIDVPAGRQLRLNDPLSNTGTIALGGGTIGSTATLTNNAAGIVSGRGTIAVPLANSGTLRAEGGTLNVANAFTNSGTVVVSGGAGLTGGAITNTGRLQGDGTIANAVTNAAGGAIRAEAGKALSFVGSVAANAGEVNLQGGTLDFAGPITNSATGFISGRGALYTGGLTNNGVMAFSGGSADIHGDVINAAGARIVTSGAGATTTFFDDVTHNGLEIFTGASASTVFFGDATGAGPFTGTGTVYFIGDLRPGNSPASVSYGGDVAFGGASSLTLEIGGLVSGSQHDHLDIAGTLIADGDLILALLDGFTPQAGDTFDLFDVGTFAGDFDRITAPALGGENAWDFSALKTTGTVAVVPEPGIGALLASALALLGLRRTREWRSAD